MDISELPAAKRELESELRLVIAGCLRKFRVETGLTPRDISVFLDETTSLSGVSRSYSLEDVKVTLEI